MFTGTPYTSEEYNKSVTYLEDIFTSETLKDLRNGSLYSMKKIQTSTYGLLFSICHLVKTPVINGLFLNLKANGGNYELYLYSKGNEFWFNLIELPGKLKMFSELIIILLAFSFLIGAFSSTSRCPHSSQYQIKE